MSGCEERDCPQEFVDGFCDRCGRSEAVADRTASASPRASGLPTPVQALPALPEAPESSDYHRASRLTDQARIRWRAARERAGAEQERSAASSWPVPDVHPVAPETLVMGNPRVPANKARCFSCGSPVDPSRKFCGSCGSANDFSPALSSGDVVANQYSVLGPIAYGGMGWIYLARDTRLGRCVVLKGLLNSEDHAARAAAAIERDMLAYVRHPLVVGIENYVEHRGASYIVMEHVPGRTLRSLRRERGPLPPHQALGVLCAVAPALSALHERGLAYCDLKPDNVMVMPDGGVKLIDLGAVRRLGDVTHDIYGTEGFLPPQEHQRTPSVSLDIYTMGRTLAALLADFDNTGEHASGIPSPSAVNRVLSSEEREALLGGGGVPAFRLRGGPLPAWLSVSETVDRRGEPVTVLHGSAPEGFGGMDLEVVRPDGSVVPFRLAMPLSEPDLRALVERATHPDPEGRFASMEEWAEEMGGVLRARIGHAGLPSRRRSSFMPAPAPGGQRADRWLPAPSGTSRGGERTEVEAAQALSGEPRVAALRALVNRPMKFGRSSDPHLRLVEALSEAAPAEEGEVRRLVEQAVQLDPWDWRPAWVEGRWLLARGMHDEAARCFAAVFAQLPGEAAPRLALGTALVLGGRSEEAVAWLEGARAAEPSTPGVAGLLAFARYRAGKLGWTAAASALSGHPLSETMAAEVTRFLIEGGRPPLGEEAFAADLLLSATGFLPERLADALERTSDPRAASRARDIRERLAREAAARRGWLARILSALAPGRSRARLMSGGGQG